MKNDESFLKLHENELRRTFFKMKKEERRMKKEERIKWLSGVGNKQNEIGYSSSHMGPDEFVKRSNI